MRLRFDSYPGTLVIMFFSLCSRRRTEHGVMFPEVEDAREWLLVIGATRWTIRARFEGAVIATSPYRYRA